MRQLCHTRTGSEDLSVKERQQAQRDSLCQRWPGRIWAMARNLRQTRSMGQPEPFSCRASRHPLALAEHGPSHCRHRRETSSPPGREPDVPCNAAGERNEDILGGLASCERPGILFQSAIQARMDLTGTRWRSLNDASASGLRDGSPCRSEIRPLAAGDILPDSTRRARTRSSVRSGAASRGSAGADAADGRPQGASGRDEPGSSTAGPYGLVRTSPEPFPPPPDW